VKWQRYTTAEGWPGVHWEQLVPTGETLFSRRAELQWRFAILFGLAILGVTLGMGFPMAWAVPAGLVAALAVSAPEIVRWMPLGTNGGNSSQGPSENERTLEAQARVVRYARWENRWAEVTLDRASRALRFELMAGEAHERKLLTGVPLLDFDELALGTDEEWLGAAGSRELREMARQGSAWVIVTQTASAGVVEIARSGSSKREVAELHRVLLAAFVGERPSLRARLDDVLNR
jgi:hypothetical protein